MILECIKTHSGGCENEKDLTLKTFQNQNFDVNTCLAECKKNKRCKGFGLGKSVVEGDCKLYRLDNQGNECVKRSAPNWDYYSLKSCDGGNYPYFCNSLKFFVLSYRYESL